MRTQFLPLSLALPLACLGTTVSAQQAPANLVPPGPVPSETTKAASPAPFAGGVIDDAVLRTIAGREDTTQIALNEQAAGVSRSSVGDNAVTGEARVDGNAFQNMSGLSILNVNTGNNVAINAAMTVNISIQAGP